MMATQIQEGPTRITWHCPRCNHGNREWHIALENVPEVHLCDGCNEYSVVTVAYQVKALPCPTST